MPEFFAPMTMAAVAVMAVNDHALKVHCPSWLTGKLSDVAICFFLPLLLSAAMGVAWPRMIRARLLAAAVMTMALFTSLEMSDVAGDWFCRLMPVVARTVGAGFTCHLTRDASDLGCLVMIPLAYFYALSRFRDERSLLPLESCR